ncbi:MULTISPECIES: hypothetical protein [Nocardiopsis]|uniref:Uncharacterized protein n=2 Tax=Nocardiopsis TaxID=2013 RepID=A0ABT4TR75_9ACTN|nr:MULTISPECIES: hypothetical protein [Nocardiopsis]MDA2807180.1 hypothetical protein [Nocardiopsis suaedae]MDA2809904.1 hypothetical protein [Nocardiopsis endophytica]
MPLPHGRTESIRAMGTIAAPLLGGFSLAATATLVTAEQPPPLTGWALVALVAAAVGFVFCVQFTAAGLGYAATPEERLAWFPAAATDAELMARLERVQAMDADLENRYIHRARLTYRVALVAFLAGIMLICIPDSLDWPRITAAGLAGAALAVELVWLAANALGRYPQWLLPSYRTPDPKEAPDRK